MQEQHRARDCALKLRFSVDRYGQKVLPFE